jgi:hypothetical protein
MRFRNSRLRTKVTALLVSLTALWAFAAWVTLREGLNLLWVATLDSHVAEPTDPLLVELQQERKLSVIRLVNRGQQERTTLEAQRARTDKVKARVVQLAGSGSAKRAANDTLEQRIDEALRLLNNLGSIRTTVDSGRVDRSQVVTEYSAVIESIFRVYDSLATLDNKQFAKDTDSLTELNRMWDVLSQEDALIAGSLSTGRFTAAERTQFTQIVGVRRFNTDRAMLKIQQFDPTLYRQVTTGGSLTHVQLLEDRLIQWDGTPQGLRTKPRPPINFREWNDTAGPAVAELRQSIQASGDRLVNRAKPIAAGVIIRLALAGGLGLAAVIASIIVSITTARALVVQLEKLRMAAVELAESRLPRVVNRLGRGEDVDIATEAPPLEFGRDAIGQVGRAFNEVQETAIRSAVVQAELRRGIRDILLSLARRSQTLVHRQLTLLDRMERRELDTTELEDLFRLDHLATRMRRNAENLIVLSGATPARGWRRSVPMMDVVRAAVAEVEDYTRITVLPMGRISLAGRAVGDITHLLAELIENAASFSPPPAMVQVGAHYTARGYAIEIEDRGLGITEERLAVLNKRIAEPPEFNLSRSVQLGLYVVGKLAQRYGVRVTLKESAYGGTTAVVLIPNDLLIEGSEEVEGTDADTAVEAGSGEPLALAAVAVSATAAGSGEDSTPVENGGTGASTTLDDIRRIEAVPAQPGTPETDLIGRGTSNESIAAFPEVAGPESSVSSQPADPAEPSEPPASSTQPLTPAGLPFRIPQASLEPALRADGPAPADEDDERRSPEEVRKLVGSYLTGAHRGRFDAAKAKRDNAGVDPPRPASPADDDEPPK